MENIKAGLSKVEWNTVVVTLIIILFVLPLAFRILAKVA